MPLNPQLFFLAIVIVELSYFSYLCIAEWVWYVIHIITPWWSDAALDTEDPGHIITNQIAHENTLHWNTFSFSLVTFSLASDNLSKHLKA